MSTETQIDRQTFTITFQRTLDADREDVFDSWTKPDEVSDWWDPTGARLASCDIDLRPGGKFRFVNESSHGPPFEGVYKTIDRPSLLVFDAMGALGTVRLDAAARGTTNMTVTIRCASAEHFDMFIKLGVHEGTARTLDNLVAHVRA